MTITSACFRISAFLLVTNLSALAQSTSNDAQLKALSTWMTLDAPPGWEYLATDVVMKTMPGWKRDQSGNLILIKGQGSPRRVVACPIDRPGFAVTEITDGGYLRLREAGSLRLHPLWVQFHEGQRIRVLTRSGSVPGVVTVKSTHLQRGRMVNAPIATLDDLWVDVGASSKAAVRRLGIQMLDSVVRDLPGWSYADYVAGPNAALRVGCAAVAQSARAEVTQGQTIFLLTSLRSFGNDGLEAALRNLGKIDELTLVDRSGEGAENLTAGVISRRVEKPTFLPESSGITSVQMLLPRARYIGSLVESVKLEDANALRREIERLAHVATTQTDWISLPQPQRTTAVADTYSDISNLLKTLADVPAVSGHEAEIRATILNSLPAWARQRAATDALGNLVVEVGPDNDPVMFIAHQDEVGFEITSINADGTVVVRNRGGLYHSLWEGQPAILHFDRSQGDTGPHRTLSGVFVPRETATSKQPEALLAWFGVDAAELKRLGVAVGQSITAYKSATRLSNTRFTSRALDDRAGSTALLLSVNKLNPATLNHKVIFAWSVREETGLEGAIALAKRYGSTVKRVFSVDTFVSSDSPAETTRFAFAPLGEGAVIRGLDNSAVAAPAEIDRIMRIAGLQRIRLQVGATNGGTDGSDFVRYGATHVSLSWPGRYSHSPVEVLDLRDLEALATLIHALAVFDTL
ncbi:MAG TPA: M28 family peptidase [Pyrinomonadaceae bacterium]